MIRFLRYSTQSYQELSKNPKHRFAQNHALIIHRGEAIYSFIPKNACSTLRTTIAYANGCIQDKSDFNWIHNNNSTFTASLTDLIKAKYTFTILRCPFRRLVSAYLDKIVDRTVEMWSYIDLHSRKIGVEDVTFDFFVRSMVNPAIRNGNIHWRPQTDFLVYEEYDNYFSLENFSEAEVALKDRLGIEVIDTRPLTKHGMDSFKIIDGYNFSSVKPFELLKMKMGGDLPSPESMYTKELIELVKKLYDDDIKLYESKVDKKALLFL